MMLWNFSAYLYLPIHNVLIIELSSTLDEIVLNYVATVLESLAMESGKLEGSFDVEEFCEMLTAYFPGFESIPHALVTQWICDLVADLRKEAEKGNAKFYVLYRPRP